MNDCRWWRVHLAQHQSMVSSAQIHNTHYHINCSFSSARSGNAAHYTRQNICAMCNEFITYQVRNHIRCTSPTWKTEDYMEYQPKYFPYRKNNGVQLTYTQCENNTISRNKGSSSLSKFNIKSFSTVLQICARNMNWHKSVIRAFTIWRLHGKLGIWLCRLQRQPIRVLRVIKLERFMLLL